MRDIRIVHDAVDAYADWEREKGDPCESMKMHRYLLGRNKPNYPVPAIRHYVHWDVGTKHETIVYRDDYVNGELDCHPI